MDTKKSMWILFGILVLSTWVFGSAIQAGAQTSGENDVAAAWSSHDTEKVVSFYTDDVVYEDLAFGVIKHGKEELRAFVNDTFAAFPDFKIEMKSFFPSGSGYGSEWVMSGTHKGNIPGLPATGKRFSVRGASVGEFKDGKIKRNSDYYDLMTFLRQIGVMPPPPTPK